MRSHSDIKGFKGGIDPFAGGASGTSGQLSPSLSPLVSRDLSPLPTTGVSEESQ